MKQKHPNKGRTERYKPRMPICSAQIYIVQLCWTTTSQKFNSFKIKIKSKDTTQLYKWHMQAKSFEQPDHESSTAYFQAAQFVVHKASSSSDML